MIRVEREAAVATVVVDRPDAMNALDVVTLTDLRDRLQELCDDDDVRALVLTGGGDRAFIAGADIKAMSGMDVAQATAWGRLGQDVAQLLESSAKPTVAAVNGFALGGGCELALACDIRYASSRAKFGQPEINLGIIPGWGGTQRLARVCGIGFAKELILTGRVVDVEEALRRGLVSGVHDPVLERAFETAQLLASKSPLAIAAAKAATNRALQGDHGENLRGEADRFGGLFASDDAREGLTAFIEKRDPKFAGH